jgi:hypothetical protein
VDGGIPEILERGMTMTTNTSPFSEQEAISKALSYAKDQHLGTLLEVHEVFYRETLNEEQREQMEAELGRPLDDDELRLFQMHNKSGWIVQLVFEACPDGATPQGPKVLVNDDGNVSHFRPM